MTGTETYAAIDNINLLSFQKVLRPGNGVQPEAINLSINPLANPAPDQSLLDGNSFLSLGADWMAGTGQANGPSGYNTLFVDISGNRDHGLNSLSAAYNRIVVASTRKDPNQYSRVDPQWSNFRTATNNRRLIDIVAPGDLVRGPHLGTPVYQTWNGSSFAAPQVTGAVALLAQYGQFAIANTSNAQRWNVDALQPEVMKAVVMNSADKIYGRLGMEKTIRDVIGDDWDSSPAADTPGTAQTTARQNLPLSSDMGTGQLNVRRALDQYDEGEYHPVGAGNTLPTQGWDYNVSAGENNDRVYHLPTLRQFGWISLTLTWNREVSLQERPGTQNDRYDQNETFQPTPLANLDLFLVDRTNPNIAGWASTSGQGTSANQNVEHIFFHIGANHEYDIIVRQTSAQGAKYALAWWAEPFRGGAGAIRGTAWNDDDASGTWDNGEDGKEDVFVNLYDGNDTWLGATTTDSNGQYEFTELDPGDYYVAFSKPEDSTFTDQDVGSDDDVDSDADEFGRTEPVSITDDEEFVLDVGLIPRPTGSVSGRVWNDADSDGIQDGGETSREGVFVGLFDDSDNLIDAAVTDDEGEYQFNWLEAGDYYVLFGAPVNHGFTDQNAGANDAVDSDADEDGFTATFGLSSNQQKENVDAGIELIASSIQGRVWSDLDEDGIQDEDESSIPYAEVSLYTRPRP